MGLLFTGEEKEQWFSLHLSLINVWLMNYSCWNKSDFVFLTHNAKGAERFFMDGWVEEGDKDRDGCPLTKNANVNRCVASFCILIRISM